MAKISLMVKFNVLEEGFYKFKITDAKFDATKNRVTVELMTEAGETHREIFSFEKKDGAVNDGALWAFSDFVQKAMKDDNIREIDTDELVGKYIQGNIKHQVVGDKKYPKLQDREVCDDFKEPEVNLDELLG